MKPFVFLAAGLVLLVGVPTMPTGMPWWPWPSRVVVPGATTAVYVYEKDTHAVPIGVTVGLNRLNRERGIVATLFEEDTTDGTGEVPEQYRPALAAARKAGLPAFVVLAGDAAVAVIKSPTTADEIVGAVP